MVSAEASRHRDRRLAGLGIAFAAILAATAMAVPWLTDWNVHVFSFPPLHSEWRPRVGPGTPVAVLLGLAAILFGQRVASSASWPVLLLISYLGGVGWLAGLATVDGWTGIGAILEAPYEYLRTARGVDDISATLHEYVERIPYSHPDNWPVHIAGHPPGALLFFVALVWLGLGSGLAAGWVVLLIAATTPVAVVVTMRRLGAETQARAAAPFLVIGPAAIWMAVSADAVFGAVAAWGLCCLAVSATSRRPASSIGWAVLAGVLLGYCVMLSYGLPLIGIAAIAVLVAARSWRPLPWAAAAAAAVVLAFAWAGFPWWEAYPVLRERYWDGVASRRPMSYWVWGNLGALCFSAGPAVGACLAFWVDRASRLRSGLNSATRVVVLLAGAGFAMVAVADLSGMSKAEVERIWLPFVPWLLVASSLLPAPWRRWALAGQVATALLVQHLLFTGW